MDKFLQQLINGISLGSIYALIALGYTMVYGIINLINFAHGEVYMLGAFIGFFLITKLKLGFLPALILAMIACSIIGIVIEKVAYKPIRNSTRIAALITAISVSLFLQYGTMYIVSAETKTFPDVLKGQQISILGGRVFLNIKDLYIVIITVLLMILLQYIIHKTKVGKAMRAVSHDREAAELMGISVNNTISYTFAIGSALAGAAGVLVGVYYNSIDPLMGMLPGLKAFIAAVIGGIGIIPGAMFGGLFLGLTETMVSSYGNSLYKDAVAFAILIIILIIKPKGDYLAIATLGFSEIIRIIFLNIEYLGGASGLNDIPQYTTWTWVYVMVIITVIAIKNFVNSYAGRACIAIREDEIAAEAMGINTTFYKVLAFIIGAFFAGIAGALYANYFYFIKPNNFGFMKSVDILVIVVFGGMGSIAGSILGAIVLSIISLSLQSIPELRMVIYAIILFLIMVYRPEGLLGKYENKKFKNMNWFKKGGNLNGGTNNR